ncbi:MAG: efflux RND transporter periplasmic adaptor subunit [Chitinophagales bacterium]|nr:efflux RND transporter periplasmic adaptor subunit [Chitinophagales bacterium]MDW8393918.1 efflux RND transporter periplasmic adaptor subunit [Chitinophagales bacterium]
MNNRIWNGIFASLLVVVLLAGCGSGGAGDPAAELERLRQQKQELEQRIRKLEEQVNSGRSALVRTVSVAEVHPAVFSSSIEVQGSLEAEQNVLVSPTMPGVVKRITVRSGQQVSKGQVLAELDNEALKRNLDALQQQLQLAHSLYERQRMLWEQKVGTEVQYLTAKTNKETLEQQVAAAREQVAQTTLTAPFSGVVDEVGLKVGELATPGITGIRVVNMQELKVAASVSEAYSARVRLQMPARVYFPDIGEEVQTTLSYVSKVIHPQSRTFGVECRIPYNERLKPNMVAVLRIIDYEKSNAIVVDVNLLQQAREGTFVLVARPDGEGWVTQRAPVTVGRVFDGKAEILSGLSPGDRLITSGYLDLVAGQPINPES